MSKENEGKVFFGFNNIDEFTKDGYKTLMEAIKHSNALPSGRDWGFYNAHESFTNIVNEHSSIVLKNMGSILNNYQIQGSIRNRALEEKTELIIEANDVILERVANNIDEMNGIKRNAVEPVLIQTVSAQLPVNGSWNRVNNATFSVGSSITSQNNNNPTNAVRLLTAKNIVRPQKFFKDKIINSDKYAWEPRIKEKPNSLKPLAIFLEETQNGEEYSHPYEFELDRFAPNPEQLKKEPPTFPKKVEETPLYEINTPEQVNELVETLRGYKVFSVDLEHHSYRSFMGITCLMQISTKDADYLIDTLILRENLHVLNEVFTKPSILKIFHGADLDIQWLQRDLSIYVVNMFDTYQAAKKLGYAGLSLAYLMKKFCNFMPNKQFQLADWRIRPLPNELKSYAREDTHYLIYIYQHLKNELLKMGNGNDNILISVFNSSTDICRKRYFKPVLRDDSYLDFYRKCKRLFNNRQLYALMELYKWRDRIAREEDESTGYVLPNHMLLQVSETLPREMQGILACCNPIPPLVRANLLELHQIILKAKEQPLEKTILREETRARGTTIKMSKINMDSPLHCPQDLSKSNEFRDDLPTILNENNNMNLRKLIKTTLEMEIRPSLYVFDVPEDSDKTEKTNEKLQSFTFLGPFERYKLVKPFIQAEEAKLEADKEEERAESGKDSSEVAIDNRTDEERIESIREHYLNLTRQARENKETTSDQSLIQMGGSKKRKRDFSASQDKSDDNVPENNLATVSATNTPTNLSKKRNSSHFERADQSDGKIRKTDVSGCSSGNQSQNNKNKPKKKNRQKRNKQKLVKTNRQDDVEDNPNATKSEDSFKHDGLGKSGGNRRKAEYKKEYPRTMTAEDDFRPYDYGSVDFRQFSGGARSQGTQQFQSNFRAKGKIQFRGNNRSSSFGNTGWRGGRERGRGRGRGR